MIATRHQDGSITTERESWREYFGITVSDDLMHGDAFIPLGEQGYVRAREEYVSRSWVCVRWWFLPFYRLYRIGWWAWRGFLRGIAEWTGYPEGQELYLGGIVRQLFSNDAVKPKT